jgi:hypothetical protein
MWWFLNSRLSLRLQIHASQQAGEARVRAQGIVVAIRATVTIERENRSRMMVSLYLAVVTELPG